MAQVAQTFDTTAAVGNREDLADVIAMITPEETPFFSMVKDDTAKAVKTEWQTDSLATPSTTNYRVQGDTYAYNAVTATSRVGNYTQIMMKEFIIAETQEAVDHAGRSSERAYQKAKKGQELKTDIEATFLSNQASVAGSSTVPAKMGGLRAWIATNDDMGSGGASGGYNSGTGVVDAATNGSPQRAFTKTILDNVIENTYKAGGSPTILMVSPYVKRVFSTFMSDANVAAFRSAVNGKSQGTIVGAADAYLSDFGIIDVVPNRQLARIGATAARNAYLLDLDKVRKAWLRKIKEDKEVAKTSDGLPCVLKCEVTLKVLNEAALGVAADLFGMTSAT
jgi:hypothetical protein